MHTVKSTTQNLIDSQVNYCSELKMSQINEDNAASIILTAIEIPKYQRRANKKGNKWTKNI